jgi:glycosyltransferase involved in cell wall biosynthesis
VKLLVVSHPCATPLNQQLYAEVERLTGWSVTLLVPLHWKTEYGDVVGGARLADFRGGLIALPIWRSGDIILHAYRAGLNRLLRQLRPDVIYVHHEPYALATAQVCNANLRSIRVPLGFYSAQNLVKTYPLPFRWTERMVYRNSQFAFPVSPSVAAVLRTKGFAGAAAVLPLGIDPHVYFPRPEAPAFKERLRQSPEEVLLGYVGRLVPEKGLSTLVKALSLLQDLTWRLVIVGSGPYEANLRKEAAALHIADQMTFVGFIPHADAPAYMSALDVLVVPSETQPNWKEQFGRVVIEAMACGVPVVGSDSGEIPNLIRTTRGGLVFAERDSRQLAQTLRTLISDGELRGRLGDAGRQAVVGCFTLPVIAEAFAASVGGALGRSGQPDDIGMEPLAQASIH